MATCVISAVMDTDTGLTHPACVVHTHWAPCPQNGEAANPAALEGIDGDPDGRDGVLRRWQLKTRRQRPFLLHHGDWLDTPGHDGPDCWCAPERFEAVAGGVQ